MKKPDNANFINKVIGLIKLIKLLKFLFTHLKLILMNFNYKMINILYFKILRNQYQKLRNKNLLIKNCILNRL